MGPASSGCRGSAGAGAAEPARCRSGTARAAGHGHADEAARWDGVRDDRLRALGFDDTPVTEPLLPARARGARILVVDDNRDMRDYLVRLLAGSWQVTEARDGDEALQLADVMMPGTDGFSLLREIRADERLAGLPVILLTALAAEQSGIEGLLAGANDYIVEPFPARELVARISAQLELSRTPRAAEERLRRVLETDNVGVLYFDHTGTDDVFLTMTGYTRAEIERGLLTWRRFTPPEWTAISEQQMERLATTGRIGRATDPDRDRHLQQRPDPRRRHRAHRRSDERARRVVRTVARRGCRCVADPPLGAGHLHWVLAERQADARAS